MAYDDMSFSKAFAAARKEMGAGKTFEWKGKKYTTDMKEEVKGTSKATSKSAPTSSIRPKSKPADSGSMEGAKGRKVQTTAELRAAKAKGGRGDGASEMARRRNDRIASASAGAGAGASASAAVPMDRMARAKAEAEAARKKTREAGKPKTEEKKVVAVPSKGTGIMGFLKGLSARNVAVPAPKKKKK